MKSTHTDLPKKIVALLLVILLLLSCMALSNSDYARKPTFYIINNSGVNWNIAYFSTSDGSWDHPYATLPPKQFLKTLLIHKKLYNNATFWITVGNKMGQFYCSIAMELPPFGQKINIVSQEGNCHFSTNSDQTNDLTLIIDSTKAPKA